MKFNVSNYPILKSIKTNRIDISDLFRYQMNKLDKNIIELIDEGISNCLILNEETNIYYLCNSFLSDNSYLPIMKKIISAKPDY